MDEYSKPKRLLNAALNGWAPFGDETDDNEGAIVKPFSESAEGVSDVAQNTVPAGPAHVPRNNLDRP